MKKTYGYCRISRRSQSIERQIRNIREHYPDAIIIQEAFTGTKMDRPAWSRLYKQLQTGDLVVFDSVSRMSRNAEDGSITYKDLFRRGVELVNAVLLSDPCTCPEDHCPKDSVFPQIIRSRQMQRMR